MEMTLAIMAAEREYARQLAEYMNSNSDFVYHAVAFSDENLFRDYTRDHHISMLLCDEEIALCSGSDFKVDEICVLSEYSYINEQGIYPSVYKYQSSERIVAELTRLHRKKMLRQSNERAMKTGKRRIISVCSPLGGIGKSTFALALADYYSLKGKTLFITFDPFFSLPGEKKNPDGHSMSDVLYFLVERSKDISNHLSAAVKQKEKLYFINGVVHWYDIYSPEPAHYHTLMDVLNSADEYETIVIDVGTITVGTTEILTNSSAIYIPVREREDTEERINEWKRQMKFSGIELGEEITHEVVIPFERVLDGRSYSMGDLRTCGLSECIRRVVGDGGEVI